MDISHKFPGKPVKLVRFETSVVQKTFQQLTRTTRFNIVYRCWDTPNIWIHIWRCPIHGGNPKSSKSFAYTFSIETTMVTWGSLVLRTSPDTYLYTPQKRCPKHSEHGPPTPSDPLIGLFQAWKVASVPQGNTGTLDTGWMVNVLYHVGPQRNI